MTMGVFVPGVPITQGSMSAFTARSGKSVVVHSNPKLKEWRDTIGWLVRGKHMGPPVAGGVELELLFVLPRPKYLRDKPSPPHIKKPDGDKLLRGANDALSKILFRDDAQVVSQCVTKRYANPNEQPGLMIKWRFLEA